MTMVRLALLLILMTAMTAPIALAEDRPLVSLDGKWSFRFAPDERGEREHWFAVDAATVAKFDRALDVPGCWDAQGVGEATGKMRHNAIGVGWYRRAFTVP